jgi:hypothetical protein
VFVGTSIAEHRFGSEYDNVAVSYPLTNRILEGKKGSHLAGATLVQG